MKNLSITVVDGFLTADPELKKVASGKSVVHFTLAVNHNFRKIEGEEPEVSYLDVEAWERTAENCSEYLKKGKKVTVVGHLKQDRWKNQEGQARSRLKIIADEVRFDSFGDRKERDAA
ncbi:single-strand binding family protein [Leptospira inadai serovar Lyme str. 10]|uniref:Single-stranded DNA-binding protein n=2 Tax=Leptospira inadai serovar Lyme TaxID=293084 RepID=V6HS61_9LEPT|nr:single-stranded DNA-binding protein [Leptospira inadai]EQA35414.1 single-strand binding family protein [Leptospira inadai serovar Lyme str. 10]PNV74178.1 single-stranded DNA-binding protein [Leptospira inadai serovar Lyme]